MDRLKHVVGRKLGGSRRFDSEGAHTIAGLGGCKRLRRRVTRGPSGCAEEIAGAPNVRQGVHRADVAATRSHGGRATTER